MRGKLLILILYFKCNVLCKQYNMTLERLGCLVTNNYNNQFILHVVFFKGTTNNYIRGLKTWEI